MNIFIINNLQTLLTYKKISKNATSKFIAICVNKSMNAHFEYDLKFYSDVFSVDCIRNNIKTIAALKKILSAADELNIYLPNINNILCNYLHFNAPAKVKISVVSEGMLVFTNAKLSDYEGYGVKKFFVALLYGLNYKIMDLHITGIDSDRMHAILLPPGFIPNGVSKKALINRIEIDESGKLLNSKRDSKICLIIGQHYHESIPCDLYMRMANRLNDFVESGNFVEVLYKPHPLSKIEDPIIKLIKNINTVNSNLSSEDLIYSGIFGVVVSYSSTVLFNVKIKCSEQIKCVSVGLDLLESSDIRGGGRQITGVREAFNVVGVFTI